MRKEAVDVFLANEAANDYHQHHHDPDNKYRYTVDFSTALRTARKYFLSQVPVLPEFFSLKLFS